MLSSEQIASYEKDGYLVLPSFLPLSSSCTSTVSVDDLRNQVASIVANFDFNENSEVFTTKEQSRAAGDYFLTSGDKIRFFWEEKAWSEDADTGHKKLIKPPELSINKVGHNLHDLDEKFRTISYDRRIGSICMDLGMKVPKCVQSMYIFKQPFIGGEVGAHQDGAFLYTEPQSVIGFWWALDDCTKENGCLWAVPGSHKLGVTRRFRRVDPDDPSKGVEFSPNEPIEWDLSDAKPIECGAGTLVVLHHAIVHYSEENVSDKTRHAYSIHVVDGKEGVVYPRDNWLQRGVDSEPFREVLALRCPNEKCKCPDCQCGARCTCNVSMEVVCDPCVEFKRGRS